MAHLVVKPVATRFDQKLFLNLPWQLYRDDPHWIPPLRGNQRDLVGYAKPWYLGGGRHPFYFRADCQTFLALKAGRPVGRIAAIANDAYNASSDPDHGFFGFFESIDDPATAHGLFDAARAWLAERDLHTIRGPVNPSQNYECGLLIDGFDSSPFFMMTYNPSYYARLLEGYGFHKAQDLYAFWGHINMLSTLDKKLDFITQAAKQRFQLELRPLDTSQFESDVERFLEIYNLSMAGSWGFVPYSLEEMRYTAKELRHLIVPELTQFAMVNGREIGGVFGLLDYNPRIREIDGRLLPFGFLKLICGRGSIRKIRLLATNVLPAYQRWGIGLVMLGGLLPHVLEWGIEEAEFSWVMESNNLSRGSLEKGGAKRTKTYRIYEYAPETSQVTAES